MDPRPPASNPAYTPPTSSGAPPPNYEANPVLYPNQQPPAQQWDGASYPPMQPTAMPGMAGAQPQDHMVYPQQPANEEYATPLKQTLTEGGRFGRASIRDIPFAAIFVLDCLAVMIICFVGFSQIRVDWALTELGAAVVPFAMILSSVYLLFARRFAGILIKVTMVLCIAAQVAGMIFCFIIGVPWVAVAFLFSSLLTAFCFWLWRSRIAFATVMLQTAVDVTKAYNGVFGVAIFMMCLQFVFLAFFSVAAAALVEQNGGYQFFMGVFLLFSYYWITQVMVNVVHTTVAGVVAMWYFYNGVTAMPQNPTAGAFKRSMTTSFGSICFGSLLVALIKTVRALVMGIRNQAQRGNNPVLAILAACIGCLLKIFERLVEYFNTYAFVQVAIYGKSYCEAGKATWSMFKERGIDAIINDDLVGMVLTLGCVLVGVLCGMFSGLWGRMAFFLLYEQVAASVALGFFAGFVVCSVMTSTVHSAVCAIFVCFAEEPDALARNKPELHTLILTTYEGKLSMPSRV